MQIHRWARRLAPILALGLAAVACGGGQSQGGAPPAAGCNSGTTAVTFWTSHTPPDSDSLQKIVASFNKQSSDACVKMTQVPGSETDVSKLMTAVRGGTGPDVYELDRFTVAERAAAGLLTDLSQYGAGGMGGQYIDYAWKEALYRGKPYALPFDTDARALYYNKDMLQAAGVDPSVLDPSKGAPSIDTVRDIANKLNKTDASGNYTVLGFVPWATQGWHYTWGFDFGASFFDQSSCKVTPTNPKLVQAFQTMFYDWAKALGPDKVSQFMTSYQVPPVVTSPPASQDPLFTGHLGMEITGDWEIGNIKTYVPNLNYGITYIPVAQAGDKPSTWAGGWSYVIPNGAKNAKLGYEFMKYIAGQQGQREYTSDTAHLPTLKSLYSDKALYAGQHSFFVNNLLPIAKSRPALPVGALYWDQLSTAEDAATRNKGSVEQSLQAVADAVNPALQKYCPVK